MSQFDWPIGGGAGLTQVANAAALPPAGGAGLFQTVDDGLLYWWNGVAWLVVSFIPLAQKGAASGVAELDLAGKLPITQLPTEVVSLKATWDGATNTPALIDGTGDQGDMYFVAVAGTQDLGSGAQTFALRDLVLYVNGVWQKVPATDLVVSVNGQVGIVVLAKSDVGLGNVDNVQQMPLSYLDTDTALAANSDSKVATQKAAKAYTDAVTAALNLVKTATGEPHGMELVTSITWDNVTREVTLVHPYVYWYKGVRVVSAVDKVVEVPDVTGQYLIKFTDAAHTAAAGTTYNFDTDLLFHAVYRNAASTDRLLQKEAHGVNPSSAIHRYLHETRKAAYASGGVCSGYVIASDALVDIQIAVDETIFFDEDLRNVVAARLEGDNWDKWYRGAAGAWLKDAADTIAVNHAGNVPQINTYSAPNWSLTPVTNLYFFNTYLFATNSAEVTNGFIMVPGQKEASTLAAAQAFSVGDLELGDLPTNEIIPVKKFTWRYRTTNTNNNARVELSAVEDLRRFASPGTPAGVSSLHNSLGGRSEENAHPSSAIDYSLGLALPELTTPANPAANYRKFYPKSDGKLYSLNSSGTEKAIGGGLLTIPIDHTFVATAEAGKHYLVNLSGASGDLTVNLPAGAAESVIRFTVVGNADVPHRLILDGNGAETLTYEGVADTTAELVNSDTWIQVMWDTTNSTWQIDDASTFLSSTFAGALKITSTLDVDGAVNLNSTLVVDGNTSLDGGTFVFNESGADKDFRIEGDTNANLFFCDASTDRIGIGTATPTDSSGFGGRVIDIAGGTSSQGAGLYLRTSNSAVYGFLGTSYSTSSIMYLGSAGSASLRFYTADTPRMEVAPDGAQLNIGTNSMGTVSGGYSIWAHSATPSIGIKHTGTSGTYTKIYFYDGDGNLNGKIESTAGNPGSTSYATTSDCRLKTDLGEWNALSLVIATPSRKFKFTSDEKDNVTYGFFAQELYNHVPQAVCVGKDDPESAERYWGVDYGKVTGVLWKAIQEQQAIIEALKSRIEALENK